MPEFPILRHTSHTIRFTLAFTGEVVLVYFGCTRMFFCPFGGACASFGFLGKLLAPVSGSKLKRMLMEFEFS